MTVMEKIKPALIRTTRRDDVAIQDPQTCLRTILDAIDMVVLPRDVTFTNSAGPTLSMTVKSRRLIRVDAAGLMDVELVDGHHETLCNIFSDFVATATRIEITHTAPARPETLSDLGVSVGALRAALIATGHLQAPNRAEVIPALTALAKTNGLNWAHFSDGTMTASEGDTGPLQEAYDTARPHILKTEQPGAGRAANWILRSGAASPIAITLDGNQCFIASIPAEMVQAWINASAGRRE